MFLWMMRKEPTLGQSPVLYCTMDYRHLIYIFALMYNNNDDGDDATVLYTFLLFGYCYMNTQSAILVIARIGWIYYLAVTVYLQR